MPFTVSTGKWSKRRASPGHYTRVPCPKCTGMIVHNGNAFCEWWGNTCDWALPHPPTEPLDRWLQWILNGYHEGTERFGKNGWEYSGNITEQPKSDLSKHTDPERARIYLELAAERWNFTEPSTTVEPSES